MQRTPRYHITHDIKENKIFIRLREGEKIKRSVQVFVPGDEYNFLFTGKLEFSPQYDTWISPGYGGSLQDWRKNGAVVRFLTETSIEHEYVIDVEERTVVLFVTPHLSTGGCPQYLNKKIEVFSNDIKAHVFEHSFLSSEYVVQRNSIIEKIGGEAFFSQGEFGDDLLETIREVNPEIIHFEELPETFLPEDVIEKIYRDPTRKYFITETTHSSHSNPDSKLFLPDKFIFCSEYSRHIFQGLNVPMEVWEYPIETKKRPDRREILLGMSLDPNKIHVLNVGLFTSGKNQAEIFEIATHFTNVEFHFIGNQASNFEHYWKPLLENIPSNCKIWGERGDVEKFMSACDIFLFTSRLELNPLVVKEALSWDMPVIMYNLPTYMGAYDELTNVKFISLGNCSEILLETIQQNSSFMKIFQGFRRTKLVHIVSDIFSNLEQNSIASIHHLSREGGFIDYTIHYNPLTTKIPHDRPSLRPTTQGGESLSPGHFGCFEAFRKAIVEDFSDDYDYLIVCERDCVLEKSPEEILQLLKKSFIAMEESDLLLFSFGDKADLERGFLQSQKITDIPGNFSYITDKIIGLQFIIISRKGREFLKEKFMTHNWYGMDVWLNEVFAEEGKLFGILNERVTTQLDGFSLIDNTEKTFIK
jgi:glycosyltransferase involved in cell wall biosynthesis